MSLPLLLACLLLCGDVLSAQSSSKEPCDLIDSGSHLLDNTQLGLLASRYRSREIRRQCPADVDPNSDLDPKALSVTSGDDADGKPDVAVLMQSRNSAKTYETIVVAFMSSLGEAPVFAGDFRCCGASLLFTNGRFIKIITSD